MLQNYSIPFELARDVLKKSCVFHIFGAIIMYGVVREQVKWFTREQRKRLPRIFLFRISEESFYAGLSDREHLHGCPFVSLDVFLLFDCFGEWDIDYLVVL